MTPNAQAYSASPTSKARCERAADEGIAYELLGVCSMICDAAPSEAGVIKAVFPLVAHKLTKGRGDFEAVIGKWPTLKAFIERGMAR